MASNGNGKNNVGKFVLFQTITGKCIPEHPESVNSDFGNAATFESVDKIKEWPEFQKLSREQKKQLLIMHVHAAAHEV